MKKAATAAKNMLRRGRAGYLIELVNILNFNFNKADILAVHFQHRHQVTSCQSPV